MRDANAKDRLAMRRWGLEKIGDDTEFINKVWNSNEADFYMNGYTTIENFIFMGSSKSSEVNEKNLHELEVTAWVAVSTQRLIGPFFFINENRDTVTVTSNHYTSI